MVALRRRVDIITLKSRNAWLLFEKFIMSKSKSKKSAIVPTILNFVAKNDFNRASTHADKRRLSKQIRGSKHKSKIYG